MMKARAQRRKGSGRHGAAGWAPGPLLLLFCCLLVLFAACVEKNAAPEQRPDIVTLDAMTAFGALERPPVLFPHDLHTRAVAAQGESCTACHLENGEGNPVWKFKRLADAGGKEALSELYHKECVACHEKEKEAGRPAGPATCGGCHRERPALASTRKPFGFDRSLHYRHVKARGEECKDCHHVYDEKAGKLVYAKGEDSSCRDCHKEETEGNRISLEEACHRDCIGCHLRETAEGIEAGPRDCAGCHDAARQAAVERIEEVPRLEAGQPDTVLLAPMESEIEKARMHTAVFNHKAHEKAADSCRACHHETLKACRKCHTIAGTKEGGGVTLEEAMHDQDSLYSCMGCHGDKTKDLSCAGCHASMGKMAMGKMAISGESCAKCHDGPLPARGLKAPEHPLEEEGFSSFTIPVEEIPETVEIGILSSKYEAVLFPHRKILDELAARAAKSGAALHFHGSGDTLCLGCHHTGPAGGKPPLCSSCHGKPFDERRILMPGLKGAYHLQCLGCHREMGLVKLQTCTACHAEKKDAAGAGRAAEERAGEEER